MRKIAIWAFAGLAAGLLIPPLGQSEKLPLPPSEWKNSALLREYRALKEMTEDASYLLSPSTNQMQLLQGFAESGAQDPRESALRTLASRTQTLTGIFEPDLSRPHLYHGKSGVRISCPKGNPDDCCSEAIQRPDGAQEWKTTSAILNGIWEGYQDSSERLVFRFHALKPLEQGLPFIDAFVEFPRPGEKETRLWGFDPDAAAWKIQGKMVWSLKAGRKGCDW